MTDSTRALAEMDEERRHIILNDLVRMKLDLCELKHVGMLLTDIGFLGAKCRAGLTYELLAEYARAESLGVVGIESWRRFFDEQSHVLGPNPHLFTQQATNWSLSDSVGDAARRMRINEPYLELVNREPRRASAIRTLYDYGSLTTAAGISRDGRTAVSTDLTHRLRVWDLETGRCLHRLGQPYATAVAISADGQRIVAASMEDLELWDMAKGLPKKLSPTKHTMGVRDIAMTPDGRWALSAGDDIVVLWDLEARKPETVLSGHRDEVLAVAVSTDGRLAASSSKDRTVRVWDLSARRCAAVLEGHDGAIFAIAMTGDGRLITSGAEDRLVKVWRDATWTADLSGHIASVDAVGVSENGDRCISGSSDGELRFWDLLKRRCTAVVHGHSFGTSAIAMTPDGRRALTGAWDGKLKLWGLDRLPNPSEHLPVVHALHDLAMAPSGNLAVAGDSIGRLHLWDLTAVQRVVCPTVHDSEIHAVAFTPDQRYVLSAGGDHTVRRFNLAERTSTVLGRHDAAVQALAVTVDGRFLLSGAEDNLIKIWDLTRDEFVDTLNGHENFITSIVCSKQCLVSADYEQIRYWDFDKRRSEHLTSLPAEHGDSTFTLALSPSGRFLASAGKDGDIWLWDTQSKELMGLLPTSNPGMMIHKLAFTESGLLVVGGADNYLRIWDVPRQQNIASFPATGNVHALAVGHGDVIVCGDGLGEMFILRFHPQPVEDPRAG
ncbi:hypothetical protein GCM10010211_22020 [Streptomyces albospinus]|uniref:WD40 repeat domain-containing protein n=1 Tax=Streptomyces albospinus TaxID=285515 RepID=A0ABQ2UW23_9ACTN|nr:WD40 repeat domain-containing protein [Streptomyces albospinus]GGU56906.1 hypothetical protein GCM10010211_22020 [Streptomyces albospinus]